MAKGGGSFKSKYYSLLGKRRQESDEYKKALSKARRAPAPERKIELSVDGIKRMFDAEAIAYALVGAVGARGLYGLLKERLPDMNDAILAALGVAAPPAIGAVASGAPSVVIPLALGSSVMSIVDMLADALAEQVAAYSPGAANGISMGVGYGGRMESSTPVTDVTSPTVMTTPDGTLVMTEPNAIAGLGQIDFVHRRQSSLF